MKKCLSLVLVLALCLSLCACISNADKETMIAKAHEYINGQAYKASFTSSTNKLSYTFYFAEDGTVVWLEGIKNDKRDDVVEVTIVEMSFRVESKDEVFIDLVGASGSHKSVKVLFEDGEPHGVMAEFSRSWYSATRCTNTFLNG